MCAVNWVLLVVFGVAGTVLSGMMEISPVRDGEFKFLLMVYHRGEFKCIATLTTVKLVLTTCDCIGEWMSDYDYMYYQPYDLEVVAGAVWSPKEKKAQEGVQFRLPYKTKKHPQCLRRYGFSFEKKVFWYLMYNYGLLAISDPFRVDSRVEPISNWIQVKEFELKKSIEFEVQTGGECKTLSFPKSPVAPKKVYRRLEYAPIQLKLTSECRKEHCPNTSACAFDDLFYFGKFCGAFKFEKAREECFNNPGAPVICGNAYVGHLADSYSCTSSTKGRYYMYARFDLAVPFIRASFSDRPRISGGLFALAWVTSNTIKNWSI